MREGDYGEGMILAGEGRRVSRNPSRNSRSDDAARPVLVVADSCGGVFGDEFLPEEYDIDVGKLRHRRSVSL
jgi:hypothetical protein